MIEHLLSTSEALGSIPALKKKKGKKVDIFDYIQVVSKAREWFLASERPGSFFDMGTGEL
jgi:hypothetical protein